MNTSTTRQANARARRIPRWRRVTLGLVALTAWTVATGMVPASADVGSSDGSSTTVSLMMGGGPRCCV